MTTPQSVFKTIASVALVSAALAIVAFGVMPAQAQPAINFNVDAGGGQGGLTFGFSSGGGDPVARGSEIHPATRCLTNREVRRGVESNGYDRVEITDELPGDRVAVRGVKGNWLSAMNVDKCTGAVDRMERVRRMQGGGFGLQFNFGE